MSFTKKVRDLVKNAAVGTTPASGMGLVAGTGGDMCFEPTPVRFKTPREKEIKNPNCSIVLGAQRSGAPGTDFGGQGHMGVGMIDLTAGLGSFVAKREVDGKPVEMNPDPIIDAARCLISQKCNADEIFKLAGRNVKYQSAVALKADSCRIVSRGGGVKITTSGDERNSRGGKEISVAGVVLNAGNAPKELLQPIPRGANLRDALNSLIDKVNDLNGVVDSFLMAQLDFNIEVMNHEHLDPINIALGMLAGGSPTAFFNGQNFLSPKLFSAGIKNLTTLLATTKKDLCTLELSYEFFRKTYLEQYSQGYINSRHNKTN